MSVVIRLRAGQSGIPPARYRFLIAATNPVGAVPNPPVDGSNCGYAQCWTFQSVSNLGATTDTHLDANAYCSSFPVNIKMVEALIVPLTHTQ